MKTDHCTLHLEITDECDERGLEEMATFKFLHPIANQKQDRFYHISLCFNIATVQLKFGQKVRCILV